MGSECHTCPTANHDAHLACIRLYDDEYDDEYDNGYDEHEGVVENIVITMMMSTVNMNVMTVIRGGGEGWRLITPLPLGP